MLIKLSFGLNWEEICILISVEYNFKVPSHSDSILCDNRIFSCNRAGLFWKKTLLRFNDLEWTRFAREQERMKKEGVFSITICKLTDKRLNVDAQFIAFNIKKWKGLNLQKRTGTNQWERKIESQKETKPFVNVKQTIYRNCHR